MCKPFLREGLQVGMPTQGVHDAGQWGARLVASLASDPSIPACPLTRIREGPWSVEYTLGILHAGRFGLLSWDCFRLVQYDEMPEYGPQEANTHVIFIDDQQLIGIACPSRDMLPVPSNPLPRRRRLRLRSLCSLQK
jgi:hypothetical protein